jgi:hypothetical protein
MAVVGVEILLVWDERNRQLTSPGSDFMTKDGDAAFCRGRLRHCRYHAVL